MDNQVGVPNTDHRPVPEIDDIVLTIDQFHVCIIKFNRLGTLIAAGGSNGSIAIVDFTTKSTSNVWNAHALGVTNITWTRDGAKLFSSGLDNVLIISDVVHGTVLKRMHIGTFILSAALNPRLNSQFLIHTQFGVKIGSLDSSNTVNVCEREAFSTLSFDHRGKYILAGTSQGIIKVYTIDGKPVSSACVDSIQPVRCIYPTRRFNLVIVVVSDMLIRVYELEELLRVQMHHDAKTVNTLYDPTSKTLWHSACASGDADYVAALASNAHEVTIFERATEAIVATLCQSKKEIPLGLEWHPAKPAVASVCNGNIFIWKQRPKPCWAAYAPDFTELGENLVYREKESEFDVEDEDCPKDDGLGKNQKEEYIDVESVTAPPGLCSSDDEDPNKKGGSVFIVNASPAVIPLKTTLPSQLRLKDGILPPIPELEMNHYNHHHNHHSERHHKKHKKKKRKNSSEDGGVVPYTHQNGIHKNEPISPSPERLSPILNNSSSHRPSPLLPPPQIASSQTNSRKSSDAIESPPRVVRRHRLTKKRSDKPVVAESSSPSPEEIGSDDPSSPANPRTRLTQFSSSPHKFPPLPRRLPPRSRKKHYSPIPSPITESSQSLSSSTVTPTHENWNEQQQENQQHLPSSSSSSSSTTTTQPQILTLPQMPPLLPPPPPHPPKQQQKVLSPLPPSTSSQAFPDSGLTNISSDEIEQEEEDAVAKIDEGPPPKRQKRSSSSSSSSSSAVNHAWDSD